MMGMIYKILLAIVLAQSGVQETPKKANSRAQASVATAEPFDGASVEKMASQCVTLETELGAIEIAMTPENAPESVRNFLNLVATGAYDTTTFSRVVKNFGNYAMRSEGQSARGASCWKRRRDAAEVRVRDAALFARAAIVTRKPPPVILGENGASPDCQNTLAAKGLENFWTCVRLHSGHLHGWHKHAVGKLR